MSEPDSEPTQDSADQPEKAEEKAAPKRARSSAQPVRVAPLKRRPKARTKARPEAEADAESPVADVAEAASADDAKAAAKDVKAKDSDAKSKPVESSPFVTVDRVDPRTAMLGVGALLLALVLIVASTLLGVGAYRIKQRNDLRAEYDAFAQQVTVNLTSLNKTNVDEIRKTLVDKTSGTAYETLNTVTQQITTMVEQYDVQTNGEVLSRAVTQADPDYGRVLMVLGWTQRLSNKKADVERQVFRWRVDMRRINGELKLTKFDWVY
ncbi:hypothetical protein [Gordonia sp. (in: high G+C Gram-positive bacteria)]|uniref:hypothetical protein n=1 Tax=Gordonia sp. (in: high G+C Gram-positive bacteria) TaxID=84139 RepID=UPI0039E44DFE